MYSSPYFFDTMPCPFKICFKKKVTTIYGGGQLLVTGSQGPITRVPDVRIPCPRVASPKAQGPSSRVRGSQVSGSQGPGSQSLGSQGPGSQGLRFPGPGSQVLILVYALLFSLQNSQLHSIKNIEELSCLTSLIQFTTFKTSSLLKAN